MKIKSITVKNFQGIKEFIATLDGMSWKVFARNGKGKTTVFKNAITWCLFEKDHRGKKLDPKPRELGGRGDRIRGLIPEVEMAVELGTGEEITLLRRLEEDVVKKTKLYKGDKGYWEVDGLGVNKTQFENKVTEIIGDPEIFKVMLNPETFLADKKWENRRALLEKMMGDINPEDVFDGSELEILNGKPLNEAVEIAKTALRKAQGKLDEISPKLEEAQKKNTDTPATSKSKEELKAELDKIVEQRKEEEENCKNPEFGKRAEITKKIKKLEEQSKDAYKQELKNFDTAIDGIEKRMANISIETLEKKIERKEADLVREKETLEKMVADFKEFDKTEFDQDKCSKCGHKLSDYLREQYENQFNEEKAETRKRLIEKGKSQKIEVEELDNEIARFKSNLETMREEYKTLKESYTKLVNDKQALAYAEPPEIAELRSELNLLSESGEFKKSERLTELEGKEENIREQIAEYNTTIKNMERVKQLEKEEEELGDVVTECKRVRDTTLELKRKWSHEIEKKANKLFKLVQWRMSEEHKNGEPKDICEAMYNGIDYNKTVSNGEGVNMCLDVHNTISRFFNMEFPAIIDNAESVTDWLVEPENQTVFLYAKEDIKEIKMEVLK